MPVSELLELAKTGPYEKFEARCLELLDGGQLSLSQLVGPFEQFQRNGQADQLATLTQMIFENVEPTDDPKAALALVRVALHASPNDEDLRRLAVELYRAVYGHYIRFNVVLEASGLAGGRPARMAMKLLDLCLALEPGDTLISRLDDRVVEVAEIDRENGLFTLRREGRVTTRPAPEVVREYDRIAGNDFRVLRQLRPEKLKTLIEEDPVALVIGLIHAHGEMIDADQLKHELVPKHIDSKAWPKWWTRARNLLKRSPHVVIEGRSPVILSYSTEGQTLEEETWTAFEAKKYPSEWLSTVESYLREKASRKEPPDESLMQRFHDYLARAVEAARGRRPSDALACALVIARLSERGLPATEETRALAATMLQEAAEPDKVLAGVYHEGLRERGFQVLQAARPDDWIQFAVALLPSAPAGLLDKLASAAINAGHVETVQSFIDVRLSDPANYPELVYWLWKGPKKADELNLPSDSELFRMILDTLSALGRTVAAEPEVVKAFRHRMKAALALSNYAKVRRCLEQTSAAAAITIRRQIQRLEGMGHTTQAKMLDALQDYHPALWVVKPKHVDPWEDPETLWGTIEGLQKRTIERDEIVNVKMRENAQRIGEAASHGDLSENAEYKFALEERDLLRARLAVINDELSRARTLTAQDVPEDYVGIGSRVTLRQVEDGRERVMTFLGSFDVDVEKDIYSYLAPVSQKLMGCRVGERVLVTFDKRDLELEVVAIANALAEAG
ncbi:MAG: GreA/GreB family elongation factor [Phycisphaerae bacterium]|nr:GreA/GreB family elongation factor [Phycisphaerae bacterium]